MGTYEHKVTYINWCGTGNSNNGVNFHFIMFYTSYCMPGILKKIR